ncbi:MAG: HD domain-containing protein [Bdellovibrionales bacterium]|nr:HD domain-containing protein [Bdellovibrionales bacterium]
MSQRDKTSSCDLLAKPIIQQILVRLKEGLNPDLVYHSYEHTLEVVKTAISLAEAEQLSAKEMELLAVAAAYHDSGFLNHQEDNEPIGAEFAEQAMRAHGYSSQEIAIVKHAILDTGLLEINGKLLRNSSTPISPCLLDADTANLGTDKFFWSIDALVSEGNLSLAEVRLRALQFLTDHVWFTAEAKKLYDSKKQENLRRLRKLIQSDAAESRK